MAAQLAAQYPFLSKLKLGLASILEENEVDLELHNLLGKFGANSPGLFAAAASDKKEVKGEFLKDVVGLDHNVVQDKALKAQVYARVARPTCAWSTCAMRSELEVKIQAERAATFQPRRNSEQDLLSNRKAYELWKGRSPIRRRPCRVTSSARPTRSRPCLRPST